MRLRIAAIAFLVATSAAAQSAEETVAYIMIGADDGASTTAFQGSKWKMNFHMDDAAQYFVRDSLNVEEIEVERISDCRYKYLIAHYGLDPKKEVMKASEYDLDFTNAREYEITLEPSDRSGFIFTMKGLEYECRPHPDHPDTPSCDDKIGFINFGDSFRAKNALKYLKEKFCVGKAF
ncbi:hypothetical protein ACC764_19675 [Rhizobium ruizarguesonis]